MRVVRCALLVLLVAPAVSKKATAAAAGFDPVSGTRTAAAEAKEPAAKAEEGYEDFQGAKVRTHTETPKRRRRKSWLETMGVLSGRDDKGESAPKTPFSLPKLEVVEAVVACFVIMIGGLLLSNRGGGEQEETPPPRPATRAESTGEPTII